MRALFGLVGLLVAVLLVAWLTVRQLHSTRPAVSAPASASDIGSLPMQAPTANDAKAIEKQFTDQVNKALQQGVQRDQSASQ